LIFNPRTSELMGEQDSGSSTAGADWAVYLKTRVVARLPEPPPVRLGPPCVNGQGTFTHTRYGDVQTGAEPSR
jgi:hypothetical protein